MDSVRTEEVWAHHQGPRAGRHRIVGPTTLVAGGLRQAGRRQGTTGTGRRLGEETERRDSGTCEGPARRSRATRETKGTHDERRRRGACWEPRKRSSAVARARRTRTVWMKPGGAMRTRWHSEWESARKGSSPGGRRRSEGGSGRRRRREPGLAHRRGMRPITAVQHKDIVLRRKSWLQSKLTPDRRRRPASAQPQASSRHPSDRWSTRHAPAEP